MIPCAPAHDTRDNLLDTGQHGDLAIFSNMEFRLFLFWLSGLLIRLVSGWLWLNHESSLGGYLANCFEASHLTPGSGGFCGTPLSVAEVRVHVQPGVIWAVAIFAVLW